MQQPGAGSGDTTDPVRSADAKPFRRRRLPIVVAVVVVVLLASAAALLLFGVGSTTALSLELASGQALRYRLDIRDHGSSEAAGSEYETTTKATLDLAVQSVDDDGVATTTAQVSDVTVAPRDLEPSDLGSLEDQTVRIADDGRQLDTILVIADERGNFMSLADPFLPFLPPDDVSPGDSWKVQAQQALTVGTGGATFTGTATLLGLEDGGVAVVEADLTETWDMLADSGQVSELSGGPGGETTNTVGWKGSEDLHMTSRVDTATGVVLSTILTGDYDLTITAAGGDGNDAEIHNTGTFRQEADLVTT